MNGLPTSLDFADPFPESVARALVVTLGLAQLGMAGLGMAIPSLLGWKQGLHPLSPMLRRLFWVYAAYVFGTNLFFGLALVTHPSILLAHGAASFAVALYLTLFWGCRLGLELAGFDRDVLPDAKWTGCARAALMVVLAGMTALYALFAWRALP